MASVRRRLRWLALSGPRTWANVIAQAIPHAEPAVNDELAAELLEAITARGSRSAAAAEAFISTYGSLGERGRQAASLLATTAMDNHDPVDPWSDAVRVVLAELDRPGTTRPAGDKAKAEATAGRESARRHRVLLGLIRAAIDLPLETTLRQSISKRIAQGDAEMIRHAAAAIAQRLASPLGSASGSTPGAARSPAAPQSITPAMAARMAALLRAPLETVDQHKQDVVLELLAEVLTRTTGGSSAVLDALDDLPTEAEAAAGRGGKAALTRPEDPTAMLLRTRIRRGAGERWAAAAISLLRRKGVASSAAERLLVLDEAAARVLCKRGHVLMDPQRAEVVARVLAGDRAQSEFLTALRAGQGQPGRAITERAALSVLRAVPSRLPLPPSERQAAATAQEQMTPDARRAAALAAALSSAKARNGIGKPAKPAKPALKPAKPAAGSPGAEQAEAAAAKPAAPVAQTIDRVAAATMLLRSPDAAMRHAALRVLRDAGATRGTPVLEACFDASAEVSMTAAILAVLAARPETPNSTHDRIVSALARGGSAPVRQLASRLAQRPLPKAATVGGNLWPDGDDQAISRKLVEMRGKPVEGEFAEALSGFVALQAAYERPDMPHTVAAALPLLGRCHTAAAGNAIEIALTAVEPRIRSAAFEAMAVRARLAGDEGWRSEATITLRAGLTDPHHRVRGSCIRGLMKLDPQGGQSRAAALGALGWMVETKQPLEQRAAMWALSAVARELATEPAAISLVQNVYMAPADATASERAIAAGRALELWAGHPAGAVEPAVKATLHAPRAAEVAA